MLGEFLQVTCTVVSLLTTLLLSRKNPRIVRLGYLLGFISLPLWVVLEYHYAQWVYFWINPVYLYMWGIGLRNHWKTN